jgi:hypothetical protein
VKRLWYALLRKAGVMTYSEFSSRLEIAMRAHLDGEHFSMQEIDKAIGEYLRFVHNIKRDIN